MVFAEKKNSLRLLLKMANKYTLAYALCPKYIVVIDKILKDKIKNLSRLKIKVDISLNQCHWVSGQKPWTEWAQWQLLFKLWAQAIVQKENRKLRNRGVNTGELDGCVI